MTNIRPNTFLIGAQKSATTSVYNWIAQHPDVCGPISMKDFPFFSKDSYFNEGLDSLQSAYLSDGYDGQKIVMQGCVQYMFFEKAIKRIYEFDPDAKLIVVLRNPTHRALSAYNYFKKQNSESKPFDEALQLEQQRLNSGDYSAICDLTYRQHGLYGKQLKYVFSLFPKENVLILRYEDVQDHPEKVVDRMKNFLDIQDNFEVDLKVYNKTGQLRYTWLHKLLFNKNKTKKFIVDNLVDPILPLHKRTKIRWAFKEWNTKSKSARQPDNYEAAQEELREFFKEDIELLESLTDMDFSTWK